MEPQGEILGLLSCLEVFMDKRFVKVKNLVRDLDGCNSGVLFPHVFLDYDKWQRLPYTWEEGLPTKLAAVCEAEKLLRPLYRQAEGKFRHYTDPRSPDSFLLRFQAALNGQLSSLREALGRCRTQDTAALVNRIGILLTPEQVFQDMEQVNAELTAAYPLPELTRYFGHIEYMRYDPSEWEEGLLKLVSKAFIRHGYNLLPAISQIEEDAGNQLAAFQKAFDTQAAISISKHITAPVQAKLPVLRELLERAVI
ncbi:hypothetical protein B5F88_02190 [Flavonifractor sp. An306]|nr:hypothetical protein B5F88_02190 [Flavonifractor sp. An306]